MSHAVSFFRQIVSQGVEHLVRYINTGGDVNLREGDPPGETLLHFLVRVPVGIYRDYEAQLLSALQLVLAKGASVDALSDTGLAPLHLVTTAAMAKLLVEAGAKVNCVDNDGRSPLHFAAGYNHTDVQLE
jgi:ankyrin repeat protein